MPRLTTKLLTLALCAMVIGCSDDAAPPEELEAPKAPAISGEVAVVPPAPDINKLKEELKAEIQSALQQGATKTKETAALEVTIKELTKKIETGSTTIDPAIAKQLADANAALKTLQEAQAKLEAELAAEKKKEKGLPVIPGMAEIINGAGKGAGAGGGGSAGSGSSGGMPGMGGELPDDIIGVILGAKGKVTGVAREQALHYFGNMDLVKSDPATAEDKNHAHKKLQKNGAKLAYGSADSDHVVVGLIYGLRTPEKKRAVTTLIGINYQAIDAKGKLTGPMKSRKFDPAQGGTAKQGETLEVLAVNCDAGSALVGWTPYAPSSKTHVEKHDLSCQRLDEIDSAPLPKSINLTVTGTAGSAQSCNSGEAVFGVHAVGFRQGESTGYLGGTAADCVPLTITPATEVSVENNQILFGKGIKLSRYYSMTGGGSMGSGQKTWQTEILDGSTYSGKQAFTLAPEDDPTKSYGSEALTKGSPESCFVLMPGGYLPVQTGNGLFRGLKLTKSGLNPNNAKIGKIWCEGHATDAKANVAWAITRLGLSLDHQCKLSSGSIRSLTVHNKTGSSHEHAIRDFACGKTAAPVSDPVAIDNGTGNSGIPWAGIGCEAGDLVGYGWFQAGADPTNPGALGVNDVTVHILPLCRYHTSAQ